MRDIFDSGRVHSYYIAKWAGTPPIALDKRIKKLKDRLPADLWAAMGPQEELRKRVRVVAVQRAWSFSPEGVRMLVEHLKLKEAKQS